jgi:hypothetical protein
MISSRHKDIKVLINLIKFKKMATKTIDDWSDSESTQMISMLNKNISLITISIIMYAK